MVTKFFQFFWSKFAQVANLGKNGRINDASLIAENDQNSHKLHILQAHQELTQIEVALLTEINQLHQKALKLADNSSINSSEFVLLLKTFEDKKEQLIQRIKQLEVFEKQLESIDEDATDKYSVTDTKEILNQVENTFNDLKQKVS